MFGTNMGMANMKSQGRNFELNIRRCCQSVKIEVQSSLQSDSKYLFLRNLFLNSPNILFQNSSLWSNLLPITPNFLTPKHANIADLTILSDTGEWFLKAVHRFCLLSPWPTIGDFSISIFTFNMLNRH